MAIHRDGRSPANELRARLPKRRPDPSVPLEACLKIVAEHLGGDPTLSKRDKFEFEIGKRAMLRLLHSAEFLNDLSIWYSIDLTSKFSWEAIPESDGFARKRIIEKQQLAMKTPTATWKDLWDSMNAFDDVVRSMELLFRFGRLDGETRMRLKTRDTCAGHYFLPWFSC